MNALEIALVVTVITLMILLLVAVWGAPMTLATVEESLGRWVQVLAPAAQLAERIAGTEFVPTAMRGKPDVVLAAILYGDEIGVGPMQALAGIHVVEGRPAPSAELMRAMILRAGHTIEVHEMSGLKARISGLRAGEPPTGRVTVEWTLDMARAAGLLHRQNWQKYPRAMLLARATSDLARLKFPDVIKGLGYAAEDTATDLDQWAAPEILEEDEKPPRKRVARRQKPREVVAAPSQVVDPVSPPATPPVAPPQEKAGEGPDPWSPEVEEVPPPSPPPVPKPRQPIVEDPPVDSVDQPLLPELAPEAGPADPDPGTIMIGQGMLRGLHAILGRILGAPEDRDLKLALVSAILGRQVDSTGNLTRHEGMLVTQYLIRIESGAAGFRLLEDGSVAVEDYRDVPPIEEDPPDE